ncbi:MAG: hypothetical protein R3F65_17675 [bacterium]
MPFTRVIAPVFHRRFMPESYACLPGQGTHRAVLAFQQGLRRHRFVVRLDVRRATSSRSTGGCCDLVDGAVVDPPLGRLVDTVLDSARNLYADPRLLRALGLAEVYRPRPDKVCRSGA